MNGVEGFSSSSSPNCSSLQGEDGQNANYRNNTSVNGIGFTFMQMEELKLQALIYKYMEAGLPVPSHLILPIWKSVLASFSALTGTGCDPSFYNSFKNSLEVEPGRCKRTDGKKWRCNKEVVLDHKYCERHLHRGRNRSRKDVKVDAIATVTTTTVATIATTTTTNNATYICGGNNTSNIIFQDSDHVQGDM